MKRAGLILIVPLLWLGALFVALRYLTCIVMNPDKAWAIADMLDIAINVGANGQVDTTISARAGHAASRHRPWGCVLCWVLDRIQPDHCADAMAAEQDVSSNVPRAGTP